MSLYKNESRPLSSIEIDEKLIGEGESSLHKSLLVVAALTAALIFAVAFGGVLAGYSVSKNNFLDIANLVLLSSSAVLLVISAKKHNSYLRNFTFLLLTVQFVAQSGAVYLWLIEISDEETANYFFRVIKFSTWHLVNFQIIRENINYLKNIFISAEIIIVVLAISISGFFAYKSTVSRNARYIIFSWLVLVYVSFFYSKWDVYQHRGKYIRTPIGWREVKVTEYVNTPDYQYRIQDKTNEGLRLYADIDGDGREDKIRILENVNASQCAIYASMNKKNGWVHEVIYDLDKSCIDNSSVMIAKVDQDPNVNHVQFLIGKYASEGLIYYYDGKTFIQLESGNDEH